MIGKIMHCGLIVKDLEKAIDFYQNILNLTLTSRLVMNGKETEILFGFENIEAKIAYFANDKESSCLVELIELTGLTIETQKQSFKRTGIAELCFITDNIEEEYTRLLAQGVEFISSPQYFDFSATGHGKVKAVYFYDIDGNILELIENVK